MPDWLTHILTPWILCQILGMKFKVFDHKNTIVVMVGALIPDIVKVELLLEFFDINTRFLYPLHTPAGSLVLTAVISMMFEKSRLVFSLLVLGVSTHFALDLLIGHVSGGMLLLFPFGWEEYQMGLIQSVDYCVSVVTVLTASAIYLIKYKILR